MNIADPKLAKANAKLTLKITGKNLGQRILFLASLAAPRKKSVAADGTSAEVDLTLSANYDPKQSCPATLRSTKPGEKNHGHRYSKAK